LLLLLVPCILRRHGTMALEACPPGVEAVATAGDKVRLASIKTLVSEAAAAVAAVVAAAAVHLVAPWYYGTRGMTALRRGSGNCRR